MSNKRDVVIGAGISGMTAAVDLMRAGRDVLVLEAADRAGGCIRTTTEAGCRFEWGPNSFPDSSRALIELIESLGMESELLSSSPDAATRLLYHDHMLRPIPMGPKQLLSTSIFTPRQKLRFLMERFVPRRKSDSPESVAQFFKRRFGVAPTRTLVDAFISGIYAGDARRIGLRSAFPVLWEMERKHGSILKAMAKRAKEKRPSAMSIHNLKDGMGSLMERMARELGDRLETGVRVEELRAVEGGGYEVAVTRGGEADVISARSVTLAVPAPTAGMLVTKLDPMASDLLFDVEYSGVLSVHAAFTDEELPDLPRAFGFLAPRHTRLRTLGWLFTSRIFPGRAPEGMHALCGYLGGAADQAALNAPTDALIHIALGELSLALRMNHIPHAEHVEIIRHVPGLPQHAVGHHRRMDAVRMLLEARPDLEIIGNYVGGISLNDCVKTARAAVERLVRTPEPEAAS